MNFYISIFWFFYSRWAQLVNGNILFLLFLRFHVILMYIFIHWLFSKVVKFFTKLWKVYFYSMIMKNTHVIVLRSFKIFKGRETFGQRSMKINENVNSYSSWVNHLVLRSFWIIERRKKRKNRSRKMKFLSREFVCMTDS